MINKKMRITSCDSQHTHTYTNLRIAFTCSFFIIDFVESIVTFHFYLKIKSREQKLFKWYRETLVVCL